MRVIVPYNIVSVTCLLLISTNHVTGTVNPDSTTTLPVSSSSQENLQQSHHRPCIPRDFGKGSFVCVCNSTYCDSAETLQIPSTTNTYFSSASSFDEEQFNRGLIQIYTSTKNGQRLHKSIQYFNNNNNDNNNNINYNLNNINNSSSSFAFSPSLSPSTDNNKDEQNKKQSENDYFLSFSDEKSSTTSTIYGNDLDSASSSISFPSTLLYRNERNNNNRFPRQSNNRNSPTILQQNIVGRILDFLRTGDILGRRRQEQPQQQGIPKFIVSPQQIFQEIIGFGGSFTDAAGVNIGSLSKPTQEHLMKSYFGRDGSDYSLGRVPMGGTDFSTRPYTLNDVRQPDMNLTHFSLQPEDHKLKIPYIKWAQSLSDKKLRLLASPWSAPVWMKTNRKLNGFGFLNTQYYQVWADYFVKFIDAYRAQNVSIWGVTTGNEPMNGFIPEFPFNCMGWSPANVKQWITNNLGPALANLNERHRRESVNGSSEDDVKLVILDDNKFNVALWSRMILDDKTSAKYVDGVGTHWYLDILAPQDVLGQFHQKYPNYFIIQTEACLGFTPWELEKVILGSWERAERYLEAIINDMRNWVGGWIDWNLSLNLQGGPNWAKWAADSAILVNPKSDEFFKQPIYYGIGHVSKFVPPGSKRIEINSSGTHMARNLQSVAFLRPDNGTVLIFLNKNSYDIKISIYDERRGSTYLTIPTRSMQTLVYW